MPDAADTLLHAPFRALQLRPAQPADLKSSVDFRGDEQRHGQFVYGTTKSQAVTVVLDRISDSRFDLYVDARRDGRIDPTIVWPARGRCFPPR